MILKSEILFAWFGVSRLSKLFTDGRFVAVGRNGAIAISDGRNIRFTADAADIIMFAAGRQALLKVNVTIDEGRKDNGMQKHNDASTSYRYEALYCSKKYWKDLLIEIYNAGH